MPGVHCAICRIRVLDSHYRRGDGNIVSCFHLHCDFDYILKTARLLAHTSFPHPLSPQAALDFVLEEQLKARVSCWYINRYLEENPLQSYRDRIIA
uniref:Uncharacterized protein n=1 Tax=Neogobius melanostomus TaxID=47308 RepID=A0A8C6UBV2_9GOBI